MRNRRTLVLVLTVLPLLCGLAGCGMFGGSPMHVTAQFRDSVGLYPGNDVSVLGVKVGKVTTIRPFGTHVTVDLEIDPDIKIPADASAVTLSPSVVTDRRVELTPVYRGGPTMQNGALIPLDRTRTPVEIDRLFSAVDRLAAQLKATPGGSSAISDALDAAAGTFQGNGQRLNKALHGFSAAVGVGADQRDKLVDLIRRVDRLTQASARNDGTIRSFTSDLDAATALLDQQGPHLVEVLDRSSDLLEQIDRLLAENRGLIKDNVSNLDETAHTMAGRTQELAESADQLPTTFQNLLNIIDPQRRKARAHIGIDRVLFELQVVQGLCRKYVGPLMCPGSPDVIKSPDALLRQQLFGGNR
ncbi:MAG TPA: MCE family protein [Pseudonocardia sp.]|jgi:phospholipid/cholesterol/gamma-HCH transport system substrate-binding protein|nr:MCE family protein [Pseudonocardia sp.]